MKKLLSSILALVLTLSLAAPALALSPAADTDPPIWTDWGYSSYEEMLSDGWTAEEYAELVHEAQESAARVAAYRASHAGELAIFNADAYFTKEFSSYWEKAEYMTAFNLADQTAFEADMLESYILTQLFIEDCKNDWAALQAEEPERTARFLAELDGWLLREYAVDSLDAYLSEYDYYDCLEEVYLELFGEWDWEYLHQKEIAEFITARGGVPGSLGIMLNGQYLSFPQGRAPYAKGGAIYADAATLSKKLGIEVPAPIDGYVAVRSVAENTGLAVYWDGPYQTVVLLDTAALAAEADKSFTILNGVLSKWDAAQAQSSKSSATFKGDVTLFDSMDGDKRFSTAIELQAVQGDKGYEFSGKYDLGQLPDFLLRAYSSELGEAAAPAPFPAKGSFALRHDYAGERMYIQSELVDYYSALSAWPGSQPAGSWHSFYAPAPVSGAGATVGRMLSAGSGGYFWQDPVTYYDTAAERISMAARLLGDDAFTKEGGNWRLSIDTAEIADLMAAFSSQDVPYGGGDGFGVTLNLLVKPDGTLSGTLSGKYEGLLGFFFTSRYSADFTLSPGSQKLSLTLHIRNLFDLKLDLTGSSAPTTQVPVTVPPAGANIVED